MSLIKNITNDLRSFDWNDLQDPDTIGIWPAPVKVVITLSVIIGCLAGGYFFHIENLQTRLQEVVSEEATLRIEFERTAFVAANLEEYRAQTVQMEESFTELLRQLPSETEVPGLVEDVTETGVDSGLEFTKLDLPEEEVQEFYIEIPLNLEVVGD